MGGKKVIGVMACDPTGVIGKDGDLPWRSKSEMQHFLSVIEDGVLVMGRKSFEPLPLSLRIKNQCIVFSKRSPAAQNDSGNAVYVSSLEEFMSLDIPESFMIGGSEIAHLFLKNNLISEFILTEMRQNFFGNICLNLKLLEGWTKSILKENEEYVVYKLFKQ